MSYHSVAVLRYKSNDVSFYLAKKEASSDIYTFYSYENTAIGGGFDFQRFVNAIEHDFDINGIRDANKRFIARRPYLGESEPATMVYRFELNPSQYESINNKTENEFKWISENDLLQKISSGEIEWNTSQKWIFHELGLSFEKDNEKNTYLFEQLNSNTHNNNLLNIYLFHHPSDSEIVKRFKRHFSQSSFSLNSIIKEFIYGTIENFREDCILNATVAVFFIRIEHCKEEGNLSFIKKVINKKIGCILILSEFFFWEDIFETNGINLIPIPENGNPLSSWSNKDEAITKVIKSVLEKLKALKS